MKANSLSFQWLHSSLSSSLRSQDLLWALKIMTFHQEKIVIPEEILIKFRFMHTNTKRLLTAKFSRSLLIFFSDRKISSTLLVRVLRNRYLAWWTVGCAVQTLTGSSGQLNKAGYFLTIKVHPTERAIDPLGLGRSASCSPSVKSCKGRNAFPLRGACQRWVSTCTRTKAAGERNRPFKNKKKLAKSSPSKGLAPMKKSSRYA